MTDQFKKFDLKMREGDIPQVIRKVFKDYYKRLLKGDRGLINEENIDQSDLIIAQASLEEYISYGASVIKNVALLKLNGGLGTSMGVQGAKSLLRLKEDKTFLDITAEQILSLREKFDAPIPFILMNSFRTSEGSMKKLSDYPNLAVPNLPLEFLQSRIPRISVDDFSTVTWDTAPSLEWCPPGHGDLFPALERSGLLSKLCEHEIDYLFVSNIDNLSATLDLAILGWLSKFEIPFVMEVCKRTASDRKGGHLAKTINGQWILRELSQCSAEDLDKFQDTSRHRYFNTNNLWLHIPSLKKELERGGGCLPLPMICNQKNIDSNEPESPLVFQLESAMGSAIQVFERAEAILVGRERFLPVKTTNDFLNVSSDAFGVDSNGNIRPERNSPTLVDLDPIFLGTVKQLRERFPYGPPSLLECSSLSVRGDVCFGRNVSCQGAVNISTDHSLVIPDGSRLSGKI